MTPGEQAVLFARTMLWGLPLGAFRGFLAPLGRRHRHLADGLLLLATGAVWLRVGFGLWGGDLRPGWLFALAGGFGVWRAVPGRWVDSIWVPFWQGIWKILDILAGSAKKVLKISKILFPSREKSVTIGSNQHPLPVTPGGIPMESRPKRKIVIKPGSRGLKWLCALLVVLTLAALVGLQWVRRDVRSLTADKQRQAAALEQENAQIQQQKQSLGSVSSVIDIAEDQLGYVEPGSVVIGEK